MVYLYDRYQPTFESSINTLKHKQLTAQRNCLNYSESLDTLLQTMDGRLQQIPALMQLRYKNIKHQQTPLAHLNIAVTHYIQQ